MEEIGAPFGVTLGGEKLHVDSEGRPEHARETGCAKPFTGVAVIVACPEFPGVTEIFPELFNEKSGTRTVKLTADETEDW